MWATLGEILPIAVGVAFSSVPIMATILILLSPNGRRSSIAFMVGFVIGLAVVVLAFTLLAFLIPSAPPRRSQVAIGTVMIVIGLALVVLAIVVWRRSAGKPSADLPKWLSNVGKLRPWEAFGLALLLNVRPKAILLSAAAGLSIRAGGLSTAEGAIVIVVYTLLAASTVAFPIVSSLVSPEKTRADLVRARSWLTGNSRVVGVLILIIIGVVIIGHGMARL
ncbi:GAP family protein [Leifsonia sp. NPDC058230]|uniref:GAP family protein n=1 Tax=Leifsonia sp. NPDC058230 TaxID=3346391 RepID=UPI0036DA932C